MLVPWNWWRLTLRFALLGLAAIVFLPNAVMAADPTGQITPAKKLLSIDDLASQIDTLIAARQKAHKVVPASLSDDSEFLRRAYLDLAGCIPSVVDARDFLDDPRPDKRQIWIEELLQGQKPTGKSDAYARHFAGVWRSWLLARLTQEQIRNSAPSLEAWLYQRLMDNARYDRMVREMITGQPYRNRAGGETVTPVGFVQANGNLPENLASSTARMFLGVQLDCARCHNDRSGGPWTQTQFWSYAACFVEGNNTTSLMLPGKKKTVCACYPDGAAMVRSQKVAARESLAQWLTRADNPFFARATANRLWSYFFGIGITEPVDAGGDHNPPSHPELLDALAQQLASHEFDLKYLIRAITRSRTYQLSSYSAEKPADPRLFSRMAIRGLSAEQLFDSLAEATEFRDPSINRPFFGSSNSIQSPRTEFLERFAEQAKRTETETSILQALYLMNSDFIADRTSLEGNPTLATIADTFERGTARQVETLFLVVLSRKPRLEESAQLVSFVERSPRPEERRRALADIFWVLLNSSEFRHNH